MGTVPPTPSRFAHRLCPSHTSYIFPSAGDVPAAANAGPSGQRKRTTGSLHVVGSRGSTARLRSSPSMTSTHLRTTSGAIAPRTTRNPSAQKSSTIAVISLGLGRWRSAVRRRERRGSVRCRQSAAAPCSAQFVHATEFFAGYSIVHASGAYGPLKEARYLMLEHAMAALEMHHVAGVGYDHIPLIRVRKLLEKGEETVKIGHIVVFAVDEHRGHRHESRIEHGHDRHHVQLGARRRLHFDLRRRLGKGLHHRRLVGRHRSHGREPWRPTSFRDSDVGHLPKGLEPGPPLGDIGAVHMHLGVPHVLGYLLRMSHNEHPAVLRPPGPAQEVRLLSAAQL